MRVTDVRVQLANRSEEKLLAFVSVVFDDAFLVHDIRVIQGQDHRFISMPCRKLMRHCPDCRCPNVFTARHCQRCGKMLPIKSIRLDPQGRAKVYEDIAHPTNPIFRREMQEAILKAYDEELARASQPGYLPAWPMESQEALEALAGGDGEHSMFTA